MKVMQLGSNCPRGEGRARPTPWRVPGSISRILAPALALLLCAEVAGFSRPARAANLERLNAACLPEDAYKTVEECPAGPTKFEVGGRRAAAFKTAPPPREKK